MKRLPFFVVVLALLCAAFPASAGTFVYTYTGNNDGLFATGALTGDLVAPGEYFLTGGTIFLTGAPAGLNGSGYLVSPPPQPFQVGGGTQLIGLDNLLLPNSDPQLTADGGLAFRMGSGLGIGIWANGPSSYAAFGGNWQLYDSGKFAASATPEPSTITLFSSAIGLLGLGWRRRRNAHNTQQ
jgi:hypothetical protein